MKEERICERCHKSVMQEGHIYAEGTSCMCYNPSMPTQKESWRQETSFEFERWLSRYYLANKDKPHELRRPSTGEIIDWWLLMTEYLLSQERERIIGRIETLAAHHGVFDGKFPAVLVSKPAILSVIKGE